MIDIAANRRAKKYEMRQLLVRILWAMIHPVFRWSPRMLHGWRVAVLRLLGARIGHNVQVYPDVRIFLPANLEVGDWSAIGSRAELYNLGPLRIGQGVTVSQRAHLCGGTHDYLDPAFALVKSPIVIEDGAWVCADAFVGPGVRIGASAIVAARAVVVKDVDARAIVAGNPARVVGQRPVAGSDAASVGNLGTSSQP